MPVRVHEPPFSVDLLDAEEAGGFGLGVLVPAVFAVIEFIARGWRRKILRLYGQLFLQLLAALDLAGPVCVGPLAELIDDGLLLQKLRAHVLFGQSDGSNLQRGSVQRILHGHADRLDVLQFPERPPDAHPERIRPAVVRRGQVRAPLVLAFEVLQRNGGPQPDVLPEGLKHEPAIAVGSIDPQREPLRRRGLHLQNEVSVVGPVRRQLGGQLLQLPLMLRRPAFERDLQRVSPGTGPFRREGTEWKPSESHEVSFGYLPTSDSRELRQARRDCTGASRPVQGSDGRGGVAVGRIFLSEGSSCGKTGRRAGFPCHSYAFSASFHGCGAAWHEICTCCGFRQNVKCNKGLGKGTICRFRR